MIGLMRLKELMLINLMNHVNSICNDDYFLKVNFRFQPRARDAHHDLMEKASMILFLLEETTTEFMFGI